MRVVIVEDDPLLREGLALLLAAESVEVVATASDVPSFLEAVERHRPTVAVVDVRMPPTWTDEGVLAAVEARRRHPELAVLVLSAHVEPAFADALLLGRGGAGVGYLLKERVGRVTHFLDVLHRVADGGSALDPDVVAQLLARRQGDPGLSRLTTREREVLGLMAEGLGNAAISERLVVGAGAVQKHVRAIFAKLDLPPQDDGVDRRVAAVLRHLRARGGAAAGPGGAGTTT